MQAHFEFNSAAALHARHTEAFPPALLALAARHGAEHVEVALTRGRWVGLSPAARPATSCIRALHAVPHPCQHARLARTC